MERQLGEPPLLSFGLTNIHMYAIITAVHSLAGHNSDPSARVKGESLLYFIADMLCDIRTYTPDVHAVSLLNYLLSSN